MRSPRGWFIGLGICVVLGFTLYSGGYYLVTAEWPWRHEASAADLVLQAAESAPAAVAVSMPGQNVAGMPPDPSVAPQPNTNLPPSMSSLSSPGASKSLTAPSNNVAPIPPSGNGTVQDGQIPSRLLDGPQPYRIYLPPGYDDPANANRRYPVVYLLHGAPGNYADWTGGAEADKTTDALIRTGRIPPMILVMPDGKTNLTTDSEWADGTPPAPQAESYMVTEVVPFIDTHYRTLADRDHRAIGGLSSGGYGGVNTALHHPEVFAIAWGLSGNYVAPQTILGQTLFKDAASVAYNSPITYVGQLRDPSRLHIYLAVGTSDLLDNTLRDTQAMEQALNKAGVSHKVDYDAGAHSWTFWGQHLINVLEYVAATMPPAA